MNNITYQTDKIRIEKILRREVAYPNEDGIQETYKTYYQGYARLPVPYTLGLWKKWVPAQKLDENENLAASSAAILMFRHKYNVTFTSTKKVRTDQDERVRELATMLNSSKPTRI